MGLLHERTVLRETGSKSTGRSLMPVAAPEDSQQVSSQANTSRSKYGHEQSQYRDLDNTIICNMFIKKRGERGSARSTIENP